MWPIAITLHVKNPSLIDEPVYDGMSNGIVSKNLVELSERQVGSCNSTKLCIMSGRNHLEEQVAGLSAQRHVAELVNDQDQFDRRRNEK